MSNLIQFPIQSSEIVSESITFPTELRRCTAAQFKEELLGVRMAIASLRSCKPVERPRERQLLLNAANALAAITLKRADAELFDRKDNLLNEAVRLLER